MSITVTESTRYSLMTAIYFFLAFALLLAVQPEPALLAFGRLMSLSRLTSSSSFILSSGSSGSSSSTWREPSDRVRETNRKYYFKYLLEVRSGTTRSQFLRRLAKVFCLVEGDWVILAVISAVNQSATTETNDSSSPTSL